MKIATWNVNSLKMRKEHVYNWIKNNKPNVLMLQEIKGLDEEIFSYFEELGYKSFVNLQKTYNGVATITNLEDCSVVLKDIPNVEDEQRRIIEVKCNKTNIRFINIYAPNGNPKDTNKFTYKLEWLEALQKYLFELLEKNEKFAICGDYNIAPYDTDVYSIKAFKNDALVSKEARDIYFNLINNGNLIDTIDFKNNLKRNSNPFFTWWDYRNSSFDKNNGARIDHILLSPALADSYQDVAIDTQPRQLEKPSDHTIVVCDLT